MLLILRYVVYLHGSLQLKASKEVAELVTIIVSLTSSCATASAPVKLKDSPLLKYLHLRLV